MSRIQSLSVLPLLALAVAPLSAQTLLQRETASTPANLPQIPTGVRAAAAGDVDGDGDEDLVVTDAAAATLYRNDGNVFTAVPMPGIPGLSSVALADLDLDGHVDLVGGPVGNLLSVQVRVWWGGSGQLPGGVPTSLSVPFGGGETHVGVADVDGDGLPEILHAATAFPNNGLNRLFVNLGGRAFATASPATFPNAATGVAEPVFVDLDGDARPEILLVSRDQATRLWWNDNGSFSLVGTEAFPAAVGHRGAAAADFDGDGDVDVVLGGWQADGVLLRNLGARTFELAATDVPLQNTIALHAVDLDGDGDVDLRAHGSDRNVELHNDGAGSLAFARAFASSDAVAVVTGIDLEDDGDRDWLRIGGPPPAFPQPQARVSASLEVVPGRYVEVGGAFYPERANEPPKTYGYVDEGVWPDFVVRVDAFGNAPITFETLLHNRRDAVTFARTGRSPTFASGFFADVTADALDEWVVLGPNPGLLANDGGRLAAQATPLPMTEWARSGAAFDVDGDGERDLVLTSQTGNVTTLHVLMQDGGAWSDETASRVAAPSLTGSYSVLHAADFDGDGDADLWFHTNGADRIYRNDAGVLVEDTAALPPNVTAWSRQSVGDVDGDGDLDLALGRRILLNDGSGAFSVHPASIPNTSEATSLGLLVDLDDDGFLDPVGQGYSLWNAGGQSFPVASGVFPFAYGQGVGPQVFVDVDLDGDPDMFTNEDPEEAFYRNMLRQTEIVSGGQVGSTLRIAHHTMPGGFPGSIGVWLIGSLGKTDPVLLGPCGWLQLDALQAALLGFGMLPPQGGTFAVDKAVPNDPVLVGTPFCVQALDLRWGRLRLGNLVETVLR
ncbi:MAG: VCBS repeat-containing protein [Planctomycetes bacterium]|nr:VCBS repeat-containing protein [Planctomycetota bacterium]